MNEELALDFVQAIRDEYEDKSVVGEEIRGDTVTNRHQDTFEVHANLIPVADDWVTGGSLPELSQISLSSVVSGLHQVERWFLLDCLDQAENVPTVSISGITHNNLIEPLKKVYNPTHLYIPKSKQFHDIDSRHAINSITQTFQGLEEVGLNTNGQDDVEACYAFRGEYIHLNQCTRLPLNQTEWLPNRMITGTNKKIPEHPLYCAYGMSEQVDSEYVLAVASILSKNPGIRDNGAVKIIVED